METVFQICLSNTFVALGLAGAAVAVAALRRWPALVHWLWVLVLIKLVTPPLVRVPLLSQPRAAATASAPYFSQLAGPSGRTGPGQIRGPRAAATHQPEPAQARSTDALGKVARLTPPASNALVMACGLGISLLWWCSTAWRVRRFHRLLGMAAPAGPAVQDLTRGLARRLGLKRVPEVWFVPSRVSPMIWSLGTQPRLILPSELWEVLSDDQRAPLLVHELAHLKRGDHLIRLLEIGVTGLYWWNPLVWLARRALRDAEEECCDAWVLWAFPERSKTYACTILDTLDYLALASDVEPLAATRLTSASQVQRRLVKILSRSTARHLSWPGMIGALSLTGAVLSLGPGSPLPRYYTALDLGSKGSRIVHARRLNRLGQIVGWSAISPTIHCYRTAPGQPINLATDDLSALVGANDSRRDQAFALDINNSGQVVVHLYEGPGRGFGPERERGFVVDGHRVIELDRNVHPVPRAINDAGQVAGVATRKLESPTPISSSVPPGRTQITELISFRTPPYQSIELPRDDIGHLGGTKHGYGGHETITWDMNTLGQVVGSSLASEGIPHAFRTAPNRPIDPITDDLGTLGGKGSIAYAVSDQGQVVGQAGTPSGTSHAFCTSPDRPINRFRDDLGTLGGRESGAWGINNKGEVVGQAETADGQHHAFLFTWGAMIDLNRCVEVEPGWILDRANDINDRGQILVEAVDARQGQPGPTRAFLLTPAPEPAPLALFMVATIVTGLGLVLRHARGARQRSQSLRAMIPFARS